MLSFEFICDLFTTIVQADSIEEAKMKFEEDFPDDEIIEIIPLD